MSEHVESDVADLGGRGRIAGPAHPVAAGRFQRAARSGGATQAQDGQVVVAVEVLHDERGAARLVTKGYDARGLLTSETYPSGANLTLTRAWNDIGALSSVTDGTNTIASMAYVGFRLKSVTFGNTTTQTNAWTGFREEVETVHHKNSGGTTLLRLDYGYDKVHTRTFERYGASGSSGDGFAYDKAQRLTTAWMGSSTPSSPSSAAYVTKLDFAMDDDGNRTSVVTTPYGMSATTVSYTSNALNQYTAVGGTSWTHDANGNVTDNGTWKLEYDYRNQIVRVKNASTNAVVATYRYDALGRRVEKDVSGGVFERYAYSGLEAVAVYGPSDAWKQSFVFGQGIDDVLMLEQADVLDQDGDSNTSELTRSYYHKNALGSVMEVTTASQTEAASYRYTPYGEVTITRGGSVQSSDPLGQHWGYTARFHDAETGLTYFRARYQDPVTGRFLQRDPVGYEDGPSLYVYVRNSPLVARDPFGLSSFHTRELTRMAKVVMDSVGGGLEGALAVFEMLVIGWDAWLLATEIEGSGVTTHLQSDQSDAWRHCMWQCKLARRFGESVAEEIGNIHEEEGAREAAAKPQVKNRLGRTPSEVAEIESSMDQMNNQIGRDCARTPDCERCCLHQLAIGRLITAVGGDLGTTGPGHSCSPQRKRPRYGDPFGRPWSPVGGGTSGAW